MSTAQHHFVVSAEIIDGKPVFTLLHDVSLDWEFPIWDGEEWNRVTADNEDTDNELMKALSALLGSKEAE